MIDSYIENYVMIAAGLFFFGAVVHLITLLLKFDTDWSLTAFVGKGLTTGTAAIIPPFFFVFVQKDILEKIQGIEYYLAISALVLFYFAIQALIPREVAKNYVDRNRSPQRNLQNVSVGNATDEEGKG